MTGSDRFSSGWTGTLALALLAYVASAMMLLLVDGSRWPAIELFNLYSDSIASLGVTVLAGAAAHGSSDPAARRT